MTVITLLCSGKNSWNEYFNLLLPTQKSCDFGWSLLIGKSRGRGRRKKGRNKGTWPLRRKV